MMWHREDQPRDDRLLAEWTWGDGPYLKVRLYAGRLNTILDSSGKPRDTDEWIRPGVDIITGPGGLRPQTGDSGKLRALAAMLLDAADTLDHAREPGLHQLASRDKGTAAALF